MKTLNSYINEALIPPAVWKRVGLILLSSIIPFLISLGVRIASLKINSWLNSLEKKHPEHKDAIDILAKTINDHFGGLNRCDQFISNAEQQKVIKKLTPDDIKKEILPLIAGTDDRKKVEELLNTIESEKFQDELNESVKNIIEDTITEGLNININDIEDDDLRKEVIKYFKTFKKGKLEDDDLTDDSDDEEEKEEKSDDDVLNDFIENGYVSESRFMNESKKLPNYDDAIITAKILADEGKSDAKKLWELFKKNFFDEKDKLIKYAEQQKNHIKKAIDALTDQEKKHIVAALRTTNTVKTIEKTKKNHPEEWEKHKKELEASRAEKAQEKDSEGNIIKKEEITDKDGKKKKVTTHTGPRGGKFYWPDGAPKDAEHKVYINKNGKVKECADLSDYLYESFK